MAQRSIQLGQDCNIDIAGSDGVTYSFSKSGADLMKFEADPITDIIRRTPISLGGQARRRVEHKGWKGTIEVGMSNADFMRLQIKLQNNYRAGNDEITFTIHQAVSNRDGSGTITKYQYTNCSLTMSKGPSYATGADVMATFEFEGDDISEI